MNSAHRYIENKIAAMIAEQEEHRANGGTLHAGRYLQERASEIISGDWTNPENEHLVKEWCEITDTASYKLASLQDEIEKVAETLELDVVRVGRTRYLITDEQVLSPAGISPDTGYFARSSVWIETDRLPRTLGPGLYCYDTRKLSDPTNQLAMEQLAEIEAA